MAQFLSQCTYSHVTTLTFTWHMWEYIDYNIEVNARLSSKSQCDYIERMLWGGNMSMAFSTSQMPKKSCNHESKTSDLTSFWHEVIFFLNSTKRIAWSHLFQIRFIFYKSKMSKKSDIIQSKFQGLSSSISLHPVRRMTFFWMFLTHLQLTI
jgi:hypothetical protein